MNDGAMVDRTDGGGTTLGFFSGLLLGTLLGAMLALFAAPKSGNELRGQLRDTSLQVTERAGAVAGQARDQAGVLQVRAQGALEQARERAKALAGAGMDRAEMVSAGADGAGNDAVGGAS